MSAAASLGRPRVGVLAVQGAVSEHMDALAAIGAEPREVRAAADLDGVEGIVLPGGESTTLGIVAEASGLLGALRRAVGAGMPVLGTCAGMIMLARETVGGAQPLVGGMDTLVRRNAFGRQRESFEARVDVPALGGDPVDAVFIRAPWVEEAGPGVEVLARHAGRAVVARQGRIVVTAFHPELSGERRFHELLVARVREARAPVETATSEERGRGERAQ